MGGLAVFPARLGPAARRLACRLGTAGPFGVRELTVAATRYRIVLRGRLSERFESAFDGMTLEHGPNQTALVGDVRDQAHLYGLLDQVRDFGIELLAVEPAEISDGNEAIGSRADRPDLLIRPVICPRPAALPIRCRRRLQSLTGSVLPVRHAAPSPHRPLAGICCCGGSGG